MILCLSSGSNMFSVLLFPLENPYLCIRLRAVQGLLKLLFHLLVRTNTEETKERISLNNFIKL